MLTRLVSLTSSCAALLLGASLANASDNRAGLNVLVFPMHRGDQAFVVPVKDRLRQAVVGKLVAQGHRVFDDLVINSVSVKTDARKAILTAIGKRTRHANAPRYDALILVTAELTLTKGTYTTFYAVRLTGSMIDPKTGRYLADPTTMVTPLRRIRATCGADCWQRLGARQVEASAAVLGATMATYLARLPRPVKPTLAPVPAKKPGSPAKRLIFRGFNAADLADIKEYLVVMPGLVGVRPAPGKRSKSTYLFDAYEGRKDLAKALRALLAHMHLAAKISNRAGNALMVEAPSKGARSSSSSNDW